MNTVPTSPLLTAAQLPITLVQAATATFVVLASRVAALRSRHQRIGEARSLVMARNAIHRVARPLGCTVTCEEGTLWLTFDGNPIDVVLEAGQSHRCADPNRLLIHALQAARVRVR